MKTHAELIAHWPFADDTDDHAAGLPSRTINVEPGHAGPANRPGTAARFDGRNSRIEVPDHRALQFGQDDFSLAVWVHTDPDQDVVGTILDKFESERRRGFHLYIHTNDGATSTALANSRQLSFGVDDARADRNWADCGRPGNAVNIHGLSVINETLYAGTLETGENECGRLWRYAGGQDWVDLGNPVGCNSVHSIVEFDGHSYCSVGRYACVGSALGETLNRTPGGQVFRVDGAGEWTDCGHPGKEAGVPDDQDTGPYNKGKADDTYALCTWNGSLYAVSNHLPGVYRYEGGRDWTRIGPDHRIMTLTVFQGALHALLNGGPVFRYEGGDRWVDCGTPEGSTQTYGAAIVGGELYVGTWPGGTVCRYEGGRDWKTLGQLGYEMEIMAMTFYNGKLYSGSLPMAHVWRMDGETFTHLATLDESPVPLRRTWSMAIHDGRLYAGTLPGGRVQSFEAGKSATWDRRFPGGWHHVAAVKEGRRLKLFVDGSVRSVSTPFHPADFDLDTDFPLTIGAGADTPFTGLMSDLRLYRGALDAAEISALSTSQ